MSSLVVCCIFFFDIVVVNNTFIKSELYKEDESPVIKCTQAAATELEPTTGSSLILTMGTVTDSDFSISMSTTEPPHGTMQSWVDIAWASDLQPTPVPSRTLVRNDLTIMETVTISSTAETDRVELQGCFYADCSVTSSSAITPSSVGLSMTADLGWWNLICQWESPFTRKLIFKTFLNCNL